MLTLSTIFNYEKIFAGTSSMNVDMLNSRGTRPRARSFQGIVRNLEVIKRWWTIKGKYYRMCVSHNTQFSTLIYLDFYKNKLINSTLILF